MCLSCRPFWVRCTLCEDTISHLSLHAAAIISAFELYQASVAEADSHESSRRHLEHAAPWHPPW